MNAVGLGMVGQDWAPLITACPVPAGPVMARHGSARHGSASHVVAPLNARRGWAWLGQDCPGIAGRGTAQQGSPLMACPVGATPGRAWRVKSWRDKAPLGTSCQVTSSRGPGGARLGASPLHLARPGTARRDQAWLASATLGLASPDEAAHVMAWHREASS